MDVEGLRLAVGAVSGACGGRWRIRGPRAFHSFPLYGHSPRCVYRIARVARSSVAIRLISAERDRESRAVLIAVLAINCSRALSGG